MVDAQRHINEAKEHVLEARKWGYSPDPWAETIVMLAGMLAVTGQTVKIEAFNIDD
jgi:hypothetical protein